MMEEKFTIFDIIKGILTKKKLIVLITCVITMLSSGFSFLIPSKFEGTAMLNVHVPPEKLQSFNLNPFISEAISPSHIHQVLIHYDFKEKYGTAQEIIEGFRYKIDGNSLIISFTGANPEFVNTMLNQILYRIVNKIESSDRLVAVASTKEDIIRLEGQVVALKKEIDKVIQLIAETPKEIIIVRALGDDPFLNSVNSESKGISSAQSGTLSMISKEPNPIYLSLVEKLNMAEAQLTSLEASKDKLKRLSDESQRRVEKLQGITTDNKHMYIADASTAIDIFPSTVDSILIHEQSVLVFAVIGFLVGLILSIIYVSIQVYAPYLRIESNTSSQI